MYDYNMVQYLSNNCLTTALDILDWKRLKDIRRVCLRVKEGYAVSFQSQWLWFMMWVSPTLVEENTPAAVFPWLRLESFFSAILDVLAESNIAAGDEPCILQDLCLRITREC